MQRCKKKFRGLRSIERKIENEQNLEEKDVLKSITNLVRLWIRNSNSHSFKLMGLKLFQDVQETVDTLIVMRETKEHPILREIETLLTNSIKDYSTVCGDLQKAQNWIFEINDILLGKIDNKKKRNFELHRATVTSKQVQEKLFDYILTLNKEKQKYSEFLQIILKHLRTTYNSWEKYLFTCYDHDALPNTNLELELSHSRTKKSHRRITGKKNSNRFFMLHGIQLSFCFDLDYSHEDLVKVLQIIDYASVKKIMQEEKSKSQNRGEQMKTKKNVHHRLEQALFDWVSGV